MKLHYILLLTSVLYLSSCNNQKKTVEEATSINDSINALGDPGIDEPDFGENFSMDLAGTINDKYEINMNLIKDADQISGTYSYKTKGIPIALEGYIDEFGNITMNEISNGKITGVFVGQLTDSIFSGNWTKPDKTNNMVFSVTKVGISSMQTKADVLSHAIGEYYLSTISGNAGANAMFDTYKVNGKWESGGSSNIGGERDGYDVKLNQKDIDLLNNMRIVVDDNMDLHFYAGLIELIKSKYKPSGMDYRISQTDKSKLNEKIAALSPEKIKYNDNYILLANDQISFVETINGSFSFIGEDNLILKYTPSNNTFELEIFLGDCCDSNVLTFTRK